MFRGKQAQASPAEPRAQCGGSAGQGRIVRVTQAEYADR